MAYPSSAARKNELHKIISIRLHCLMIRTTQDAEHTQIIATIIIVKGFAIYTLDYVNTHCIIAHLHKFNC